MNNIPCDSQTIIEIFNDRLQTFLTQIQDAFPNIKTDENAQVMETKLKTTILISPHVPIDMFYAKFVIKYDTQIQNRDEKFFGDLMKTQTIKPGNPMSLFIYIYDKATPTNKKIIWDYINQLRLLAEKYHVK